MTDTIDVQELLGKLAKSYLAELPHRLDEIESIVLSVQSGSAFPEQLEKLYRMVHSLKGTAGTYGFHIITTICHKFEDSLSSIHGDPRLFAKIGVDHWLKYVDLIRTSLNELENENANFLHIEEELAKLAERQAGHAHTILHGLIISTTQLYENICTSVFSEAPIIFSFCQDGHEALGRLLNEPFDLLITDMETPTLNGIALVGALRLSNNRNKNIKTVLLTSAVPQKLARYIDPDYVVEKDSRFIDNLTGIIEKIMEERKK